MKRTLLLSMLICSIVLSQPITWTEITSNYTLPTGIKVFRGDRLTPKLRISYIDVDMNNPNLVIHPYISSSNRTVKDFVPFVGAYAGINGGFFGGTSSFSAVVYPSEVKAQNVATVTRNSQSYPLLRSFFGMNFDRSFHINWIYHFGNNVQDIYTFSEPMPYVANQTTPLPPPQQSSGSVYQNLLIGIGGAPTLVKNGQINVTYDQEIMWGSGVGYDNRDPRTAVGYTSGNHVIMITADGRQPAISEGVGLPELAQIMIDLGCLEAMNLDGGGSTQMAVGNQYVNIPSENRAIPTILTVTHKDSMHIPPSPQYEKIIDTGDPEAGLIGSGWFASANPGFWPPTQAQLHAIGNGSAYAEFRPDFPADAQYEVYGWWVASSNRCTDTPFIIKHKNGADTVRVNQVQNNSTWKLIGTYRFNPDTSQKILISDAGTSGTYIVADAIKLISYDPATDVSGNDYTQAPAEFNLFQNYPNPFNPVTQIRYTIPQLTNIQLKIYNILGQEVKTLMSSEQPAGAYRIEWDGTNSFGSRVASGIYVYKIVAGKFVQSKKMMYLK
jgi:hypothetical protein